MSDDDTGEPRPQRTQLRLVTESKTIVDLPEREPSREGWSKVQQDALELARLGALPMLDYERRRLGAAKELGVRVSWLDRKIEEIRQATAIFGNPYEPPSDGRVEVGLPITIVRDDGDVISFLVKAGRTQRSKRGYLRQRHDVHIVVLADGNGTVIESYPIKQNDD